MDKQVYIAGASFRGQTLKEYLTFLDAKLMVKAFLVDDLKENPKEIQGIPVLEIAKENCDSGKICPAFPVYLATRGLYHEHLTQELYELGFQNIIPVTVDLDRSLRNQYVKEKYKKLEKAFIMLQDLTIPQTGEEAPEKIPNAEICVATSVVDKKLQSHYELTEDEKVIQVGTELTGKRLEGDIRYDNLGQNISKKNRQYCELTALYWIWKNSQTDIAGLCHYRRHFLLPRDWKKKFVLHNVDVVLPVPLYVAPSLSENYRMRHDAMAWDYMMQYLRDNRPTDYEKAALFFDGNLYSPCNMFIARREVLQEMCEWLFPVVDAVAEYAGERKDAYANRYPACMAERLMTYYFETRRDRYKLVYADKNFLM